MSEIKPSQRKLSDAKITDAMNLGDYLSSLASRAVRIGNASAMLNGRKVWSREDVAVAMAVYAGDALP